MRSLTKREVVEKGLAIDTGLCTMCGICVGICPRANIKVAYNEHDPELVFADRCNDCGLCYTVCPGKNVPLRDLDKFVFGRERNPEKDVFGIFDRCYQAYAVDPEIRQKGASGGAASALLVYALKKKLINGAVVVAYDEKHPWQPKPLIARSKDDIVKATASKVAIVPVNSVLGDWQPGMKLGCVGLPCHAHGLRKLQYFYPNHRISRAVSFIIGIFCGQNAPFRRTEYFLKEWCGISSLDEVKSLNYRVGKDPHLCEVIKTNGEVVRIPLMSWFGLIFFEYERCRLCWDWAAEESDISIGDFWGLPAEESEAELGSSTVLVRTKTGDQLLKGAAEAGYIRFSPTPVGPQLLSTGCRHKKQGNASVILNFRKYGWPTPDYQYLVRILEPILRKGAPYALSSMPLKDRLTLMRKRGPNVLWYTSET